ncbi:unnamed protein product [Vicia faba]|uniref:Uncharacterized protein n=1 Tax=Vicia faba TaxID=3906 RepID=A0AAV1AXV6_VICFA|nr:unnamed protein product [Vicia faba]
MPLCCGATFMFAVCKGLLAIQLTAVFKNLHPPSCAKESSTCIGPTAGQMTFLFSGFCLLLIGAAGIRPCNLAFGVDQFNPKTESGKKGINSFFNWYYFTFTFAQMISLSLIVYVQSSVSWAIGLGIPAALMLLACVLFFMGDKLYVKVKPSGSPIKSIVQVLVVAVKKRRVKLPAQHPMLSLFDYVPSKCDYPKLPHTYQFRRLLSYPSGWIHTKCGFPSMEESILDQLNEELKEKIKNDVYDMAPWKSPSPDGYRVGFYQNS